MCQLLILYISFFIYFYMYFCLLLLLFFCNSLTITVSFNFCSCFGTCVHQQHIVRVEQKDAVGWRIFMGIVVFFTGWLEVRMSQRLLCHCWPLLSCLVLWCPQFSESAILNLWSNPFKATLFQWSLQCRTATEFILSSSINWIIIFLINWLIF